MPHSSFSRLRQRPARVFARAHWAGAGRATDRGVALCNKGMSRKRMGVQIGRDLLG